MMLDVRYYEQFFECFQIFPYSALGHAPIAYAYPETVQNS